MGYRSRLATTARWLAALLFSPNMLLAQARTATDDYLVARDKYIMALSQQKGAKMSPESVQSELKVPLQDLQNRLMQIVGPVAVKGFSESGTINRDDSMEGVDPNSNLDGISFNADGYGKRENYGTLFVSTRQLASRWIEAWQAHAHDVGWMQMPDNLNVALKSEFLYTMATFDEMRVYKLAELPLTPTPSNAEAFAVLALRSGDDPTDPPNEIDVAVLDSDRLFVFLRQQLEFRVRPIQRCTAIWADYQSRSNKLWAAYRASGLDDTTLSATHLS